MIEHLSLGVSDLAKSAAFYDAALAPLGYVRLETMADAVGFGLPGASAEFWLGGGSNPVPRQAGTHVAMRAPNRAAVEAFHRAAVHHGAADNGRPGLRPEYRPNYFAAFVIDRDGHHIEAVCFDPA